MSLTTPSPYPQGADPKTPLGPWVLLVQENGPLCDLMTGMLTRGGFRVRSAASALDGLALYRTSTEPFSMVIANVMAPSLNGWRLAESIHSNDPDLPVLLLSSSSALFERPAFTQATLTGGRNGHDAPAITCPIESRVAERFPISNEPQAPGDTQARVLQMTTGLRSLVRELSFLCDSQSQGVEEILTFEIMENFKSSVDAMRQLLWRYVESTFGASGSRMEMREPRLRRAAQILVSLSQPGAPTPFPAPAKLSFFEHIEFIVAKHIPAPELSWRNEKSAANGAGRNVPHAPLGLKVLLVEPEDVLRAILTELLVRRGLHVFGVSSASQAWNAFTTTHQTFDLLVADVMPSMEGLRLAKAIHVSNPDVPALLISTYSLEEVSEGEEVGYPLLQKPFTGPQLIDKIQQALLDHAAWMQ